VQLLPIDAHLDAILGAWQQHACLILTATPGAGKSTRLPPALLPQVDGDLLVLQPRRVAARALARRVAQEQGWTLGETIGFKTRFESQGTAQTRLWYCTEGILLRRLHRDPYLEGIGGVILDEFHERSVALDLLLAWLHELRGTLREDLKLLVMSATMETDRLHAYLQAPVFTVPGDRYPIHTIYQPGKPREALAEQVFRALQQHAREPAETGDVLVFLPGLGEIRACQDRLQDQDRYQVQTLHGSQPPPEQDAVLQQHSRPRVVLATNLAETSLTVPGVRLVIDAGQHRVDRFDVEHGFEVLHLEHCPQFSADQRQGRAGRQGPGVCIRLWSKLAQQRRPAALTPAVQRQDPVPIVAELKAWWGTDPHAFGWFEAPATERLDTAAAELAALGLLQADGSLNQLGHRACAMPVHPRLASLLLWGEQLGLADTAATLAAILSERDMIHRHAGRDGELDDISRRLAMVFGHGTGDADRRSLAEVKRVAADLRRLVHRNREQGSDVQRLLLQAWPDRVAVRTAPGANRIRLASGAVVQIDEQSHCFLPPGRRDQEPLLALGITQLRGRAGKRTVLRIGLPCSEELLQDVHPERFQSHDLLRYDPGQDRIRATRVLRFGRLDLRQLSQSDVSPTAIADCLYQALLPQVDRLASEHASFGPWLARARYCGALSDATSLLADCLHDACQQARSRAQVLAADWLGLVQGWLPWELLQTIEQQAPAAFRLPSGRLQTIDYEADPGPVLAARIQECFGLTTTPTLLGRPLVLHLLAPNGRVQQVTDDLPGFWHGSYQLVRKDLRGRYPKHPWPENPASAEPCGSGGKRRR
jgi:ATP-dependent helicase HrpB